MNKVLLTSSSSYQVVEHLVSFFSQIIGHSLCLAKKLVNGHVGFVLLSLGNTGVVPVQGRGGAVDLDGDVWRV